MNAQNTQYFNKLQQLYSFKVQQVERALAGANKFRIQVLQAEADAICQELKQLGLLK